MEFYINNLSHKDTKVLVKHTEHVMDSENGFYHRHT